MTSAVAIDNHIADYMRGLDTALGGITPEQKNDILREIRGHITESVSGSAEPDKALERVIRMLGNPRELPERYRTEALLTRASRSFSPWVLFQTSWRWAKL